MKTLFLLALLIASTQFAAHYNCRWVRVCDHFSHCQYIQVCD